MSDVANAPLAFKMRPTDLSQFVGQAHLLGEGRPLSKAWENHSLHSMILWGPPGSGKTTLAMLLADNANAFVTKLSAVLSGVKDIRSVVDAAKERKKNNQATVLFVDEIHRFNKAQQDAFLPYVEDGTLILIGATTENPSFELNNALLSRTRVYVLKRLNTEEIFKIMEQALLDQERGLGKRKINFPKELLLEVAGRADGDARSALNFLEICVDFAANKNGVEEISREIVNQVITDGVRRFDKHGDLFYEQISALHKSVRGSNPDGALYWLSRMLDGGCDPLYVARRAVRMASEDIGNADPRGLEIALTAWEAYERLGSPEGELAIAQAIVYLAMAPKSNAVYLAFGEAMDDAKKYGTLEVPKHICNAPTKMMKEMEYGKGYRYAHDEAGAFSPGVNYFPEGMPNQQYYHPAPRGLEIKIGEKLAKLRELDRKAEEK
jgi:putative ATPase